LIVLALFRFQRHASIFRIQSEIINALADPIPVSLVEDGKFSKVNAFSTSERFTIAAATLRSALSTAHLAFRVIEVLVRITIVSLEAETISAQGMVRWAGACQF
jgi:hypothetical protein